MIFDTSEVVVNPGESLNLECGLDAEFRHCIWVFGDIIYQVREGSVNGRAARGIEEL